LAGETTTDLSMLERLVKPRGKDVLDIGCGGGTLVRDLAARGTRAIGVEITAEQLAPALARDGDSGARYLVGRAQELPLIDASVDVAVFMRTLHHVPMADLTQALAEAGRVLRRGGRVYVAEPLAHGGYFALTSLVEDELEVREAAQAALAQAALAGLDRVTTVDYYVRLRIADLAAFRSRIVSVDPARAAIFDERQAELADAFLRLGETGDNPGERCFLQPMRADVLCRLRHHAPFPLRSRRVVSGSISPGQDSADGRFEPLSPSSGRRSAVANVRQSCTERQVTHRKQRDVLLASSSEPAGERGEERIDSVIQPRELGLGVV
jgi:SAM-dependent methyltransferase